MKTKTYNVYKFAELTAEQQAKAIENLRDINTDIDWYRFELEDYCEELDDQGFTDADITFSGFWSQGDGASFTAKVDLDKFLKARRLANKYRKALNAYKSGALDIKIIKSSHQYEHEYTMTTGYSDDNEVMTDELENYILEEARELARGIYERLRDRYEYLASDEAIIETIEANDYDFTANGKID